MIFDKSTLHNASNSTPIPQQPGIYGWFFKNVPPLVPTGGCVERNGLFLLYVGIAPSRKGGQSNLNTRIRTHYRGTARRSTLRQTLGTLLNFKPAKRCVRSPFIAAHESALSQWMAENAFVAIMEHPAPWDIERHVIETLKLPLNIQHNAHPFAAVLRQMRHDNRQGQSHVERK